MNLGLIKLIKISLFRKEKRVRELREIVVRTKETIR